MALDQQASEIIILKAKLYDANEDIKTRDDLINKLGDKLKVNTYSALLAEVDKLLDKQKPAK